MKIECPECGSTDITRNIHISQHVEVGSTGLKYKAGTLFSGTEPLLADLCRDCGTVLRFHVKNPDRKWETQK
jgi:hypothetical protein